MQGLVRNGTSLRKGKSWQVLTSCVQSPNAHTSTQSPSCPSFPRTIVQNSSLDSSALWNGGKKINVNAEKVKCCAHQNVLLAGWNGLFSRPEKLDPHVSHFGTGRLELTMLVWYMNLTTGLAWTTVLNTSQSDPEFGRPGYRSFWSRWQIRLRFVDTLFFADVLPL